ncbi:tripartite tricarboxylate transporter permease [Halalkalibacter okhensis]|uniref:tripartite tricarboxylate transporter permease n=1 Tax=Halalkalibacter okhensis TaxID=333138 RepID=UPI0006900E6C|nr:tripartite tricarboxylate transporter permease [Halalkalibacter okhensis]
MGFFEAILTAFSQIFEPGVLLYLIIGATVGLLMGVIPGLNGHFALAMLIPFLYSMDPIAGIAFLLGAHTTVTQGGGLTAILFSTPGTGQNAATLLDGPALTKKGLAGEASGAALLACFLGAVFGALVLAGMIPLLQHIVLLFGPPEIFALAFLALTFIAVLGKEDLVRSFIAAFLGLLIALVGLDGVTNVARFTFGSMSLRDGLSLVPVILGLFALSEIIELWMKGGSLASGRKPLSAKDTQKQIFKGMGETLKRKWLVIRCSGIGSILGIIPGLGSTPAAFLAYAHAKQTSNDPDSFGKGNIEGVIGSEAANDAVEGGSLASTVAFGIPGSSSMAIFLGGLFILGLETGTPMLTTNLNIVFVMILTIILANLVGTIVGMFLVNPLARVTFLRGSLLVPILTAIIFTGAFTVNYSWFDIGVVLVFGLIGFIMKELNYSRAALLIGFVLAHAVEKNLYLALRLKGNQFYLEPIPLALIAITFLFLAYTLFTIYRNKRKMKKESSSNSVKGKITTENSLHTITKAIASKEILFVAVLGLIIFIAFIQALSYSMAAALAPYIVLTPLMILILIQSVRIFRVVSLKDVSKSITELFNWKNVKMFSIILWMIILSLLIYTIGHYFGMILFLFTLFYFISKEKLRTSILLTICTVLAIYLVFEQIFNIELYRGIIYRIWQGYNIF